MLQSFWSDLRGYKGGVKRFDHNFTRNKGGSNPLVRKGKTSQQHEHLRMYQGKNHRKQMKFLLFLS